MKHLVKLLVLLSLSIVCFAQNDVSTTPTLNCQAQSSAPSSTSGTPITIDNVCGGLHGTFVYSWTGTASAMNVVLKGCMNAQVNCAGGTTLDTNTSTTSGSVVKPTIDTAYDYFMVTPTWTGSIVFTVSDRLTMANGGSN